MDDPACFFPRTDDEPLKPAFVVPCQDGAELYCFRYKCKQNVANARTLVYFHGNGELVSRIVLQSDMPELPNQIDAFYSLNCHLLLVEYRGYGASTTTATIRSLIEDVKPIYNALGVSEDNIVVMGRSIGTIAALAFATAFPRVRSLVVESGMSDPATYIQERSKRAESEDGLKELQQQFRFFESTLRKFSGQLLFLHCADDSTFTTKEVMQSFAWSIDSDQWAPTACSKCKAAETSCSRVGNDPEAPQATVFRAENRELVLFDAGGHNFIFPLNWKVYSHFLRCLVSNEASTGAGVLDLTAVDGGWWPAALCRRQNEARGTEGRCAIS